MPARTSRRARSSARVAILAARRDQGELVVILPLTQRLDEIDRRTPLPARAVLEEPLKVAVQEVRDSNPMTSTDFPSASVLPQPRPEALRLDHDASQIRRPRRSTCVW